MKIEISIGDLGAPIINKSANTREHKGNRVDFLPNDYVVIDTETTGFSPYDDELIEIAALRVKDNNIIDSFQTLVKPTISIPENITLLTGITNQMADNAPDLKTAIYNFKKFINDDDILLGHNINFDINFLYDNSLNTTGEPISNNFFDTLTLSRKCFLNLGSYRLGSIARQLKVEVENSHRALDDCYTLFECYKKLKTMPDKKKETYLAQVKENNTSNPLYGKKCVFKRKLRIGNDELLKSIVEKFGGIYLDMFYSHADYLILSNYIYKKYINNDNNLYYFDSEIVEKAHKLSDSGSLKVISEDEFYNLSGITLLNKTTTSKSSEIIPTVEEFDENHPLYGKTCVFTGTLDSLPRKDAMQLVVNVGGFCGNSVTKKTDYLILGNNDYCASIKGGKSAKQKKAEELQLSGSDIEIIPESVFYDMFSD